MLDFFFISLFVLVCLSECECLIVIDVWQVVVMIYFEFSFLMDVLIGCEVSVGVLVCELDWLLDIVYYWVKKLLWFGLLCVVCEEKWVGCLVKVYCVVVDVFFLFYLLFIYVMLEEKFLCYELQVVCLLVCSYVWLLYDMFLQFGIFGFYFFCDEVGYL